MDAHRRWFPEHIFRARNGLLALRALEAGKQYQLILMDFQMPHA
jgi:CheY-like chemotaxis protein